MKVLFISFLLTFCSLFVTGQNSILMERSGNVYKIPCKVNGVALKFIFDTGASDVCLSTTEAMFMLKNGYLKSSDFGNLEQYQIANGQIAEGTKVNLRKFQIGSFLFENIEATIIHNNAAPLLLGQSALKKLGYFSIDYSTSTLYIGKRNEDGQRINKYNPFGNNSFNGIDFGTPKDSITKSGRMVEFELSKSEIGLGFTIKNDSSHIDTLFTGKTVYFFGQMGKFCKVYISGDAVDKGKSIEFMLVNFLGSNYKLGGWDDVVVKQWQMSNYTATYTEYADGNFGVSIESSNIEYW